MTTRRKKSASRPAQPAKAASAASAAQPSEEAAALDMPPSSSPADETAESPQASVPGGNAAPGAAPQTAQKPAPASPETSSPADSGPCAAEDAAREVSEAALPGSAADGGMEEVTASSGEPAADAPRPENAAFPDCRSAACGVDAPRPEVPGDAQDKAEKVPGAEGEDRPSEAEAEDDCRAAGPERLCGNLPVNDAACGLRKATLATEPFSTPYDAACGLREESDAAMPEAGLDAPGAEGACEDTSLAVMEDSLRHGRRVAVIAATLFQDLMELHGLSDEWGHRLHHAALLHDIGFVEGKKGHHKASMRLIEENADLNLSDEERLFVALLARYHRKAWPSRRHARFAALKKRDQEALRKAAAILRIADALDYGHAGAVGPLAVTVRKRRVILAVQCRSDCSAEVRRVGEKSDLFRHVFGRKVECLSLHD